MFSVTVVGAGIAGISCAYRLKEFGFRVALVEASSRVGGRIKTNRSDFVPGLAGEMGAMRIPKDHNQVQKLIKMLKLHTQPFEQENKLIYLSNLEKPIRYSEFENRVRSNDIDIYKNFPGLKNTEKRKTPDELWAEAISPVKILYDKIIDAGGTEQDAQSVIVDKYDRYSLRTYFEEVAGWSQSCVNFFETCSAHVVLDNSFIDSWLDAFLSLQGEGKGKGMVHIRGGMDRLAWEYLKFGKSPLTEDLWLGHKVVSVSYDTERSKVEVLTKYSEYIRPFVSDFVIFAIPAACMKAIVFSPEFNVEKRIAIRESRYVDVVKILLQFRHRWWEKILTDQNLGSSGGVISDLRIRYSVFPNKPVYYKGSRGVILASYIFEDDVKGLVNCPDHELVEMAIEDLAKIFGDEKVLPFFETGSVQKWSREAFLGGGAFCYFSPKQRTKFLEELSRPEWNDSIFFAGEHISSRHGWIEGALESSIQAVTKIKTKVMGMN